MEINEKYISIRGKIATDKDYDFGADIPVIVTVVDIQDTDNMDGSKNRVYKCKLFNQDEK